ncbi:hypothetical protein [Psychrobacter lutiphocae]|uniref:hypothetical protein n=1 Tax=Psychrobacter lutiphocae TaxID=540500 RepID=UPI001917F9BB|nr:hypothetical protein [Psychrobacter lutiphocae]
MPKTRAAKPLMRLIQVLQDILQGNLDAVNGDVVLQTMNEDGLDDATAKHSKT